MKEIGTTSTVRGIRFSIQDMIDLCAKVLEEDRKKYDAIVADEHCVHALELQQTAIAKKDETLAMYGIPVFCYSNDAERLEMLETLKDKHVVELRSAPI